MIIVTLIFLTSTNWFPPVWSATESSPTAAPTSNKREQLEELKERLATKVAELRDVTRRAVYGTVKNISLATATVETKTKDLKIELTDEVKVIQYLTGKRTIISLEDLAKGDPVTVFGEYDATLDLLKAKVIFIESKQTKERVNGVVADVDSEEFVLVVKTPEDRRLTVDFEKATKTTLWSKEKGLTKGGFSKISLGDTLYIVGTPVPKKEERLSASRILDLGNLTGAPVPTATSTETPTPKATPTVKATAAPKATPKAAPTPTTP